METRGHLLGRSAVWSSETLVQGMASVSAQPDGLLVKTEEDQSMANEYAVPYWNFMDTLHGSFP